jgi:hypothetical protein
LRFLEVLGGFNVLGGKGTKKKASMQMFGGKLMVFVIILRDEVLENVLKMAE